MRDLAGFPAWYCWLHNISEQSKEQKKIRALCLFKSLRIKKEYIPKFLLEND